MSKNANINYIINSIITFIPIVLCIIIIYAGVNLTKNFYVNLSLSILVIITFVLLYRMIFQSLPQSKFRKILFLLVQLSTSLIIVFFFFVIITSFISNVTIVNLFNISNDSKYYNFLTSSRLTFNLWVILVFILSTIIFSLIYYSMNKKYTLPRFEIQILTNISTFLTVFITIILLSNSTYSSLESTSQSKTDIQTINIRLDKIEKKIAESNKNPKSNKSSNEISGIQKQNKDEKNKNSTSNITSEYWLMFPCVIIYVVANYYLLLSLFKRKRKREKKIKKDTSHAGVQEENTPSSTEIIQKNIVAKEEVAVTIPYEESHVPTTNEDTHKSQFNLSSIILGVAICYLITKKNKK
ncbi:hypothetical protein M3603_01350 [Rummeliibacillus stabekisii]|uniref:hypothetical protein n=1 Tax=Rummeliibacillus stabekisii TaxID=241244 RepID=UPI002040B968|nr:hypothetical protein [Rummeliibacillus stabekisii]MCM3315304.1 hypothetical protein [Rummeliibacillus stabekisii]